MTTYSNKMRKTLTSSSRNSGLTNKQLVDFSCWSPWHATSHPRRCAPPHRHHRFRPVEQARRRPTTHEILRLCRSVGILYGNIVNVNQIIRTESPVKSLKFTNTSHAINSTGTQHSSHHTNGKRICQVECHVTHSKWSINNIRTFLNHSQRLLSHLNPNNKFFENRLSCGGQ